VKLQQTLDNAQKTVANVKSDEAERLKQLQAATDDLGSLTTVKEGLLAELVRVQAGQRDVIAQIHVAEDQLKRADATVGELEQRRVQLQQTEKVIAAFESRLGELDRDAGRVEQKIRSLAEREAVVQAVKDEVDNIREISGRSRADLQFVSEHRADVADLRAKIDDLLSRVADTDARIAGIESRRRVVEEVQALYDVNVFGVLRVCPAGKRRKHLRNFRGEGQLVPRREKVRAALGHPGARADGHHSPGVVVSLRRAAAASPLQTARVK
jgi:chromosome segregation ATPase